MLYQTLEKIKNVLIENHLTVATGESCTGGLICSYLTDIDGASEYIKESYVTYSNESKQKILNVQPEIIQKYGVYSYNTAKEMCKGLVSKADVGISTTGITGPSGGNDKIPVGTVFVGIGNKSVIKTFEYHSPLKTRIEIKQDMASFALKMLLDFLENKNIDS